MWELTGANRYANCRRQCRNRMSAVSVVPTCSVVIKHFIVDRQEVRSVCGKGLNEREC